MKGMNIRWRCMFVLDCTWYVDHMHQRYILEWRTKFDTKCFWHHQIWIIFLPQKTSGFAVIGWFIMPHFIVHDFKFVCDPKWIKMVKIPSNAQMGWKQKLLPWIRAWIVLVWFKQILWHILIIDVLDFAAEWYVPALVL